MANHVSRVCLVTPGHLGSNPRIVKEANALSAAGYDVTVVYCESHRPAIERDRSILKNAQWKTKRFSIFSNRLTYVFAAVLRKIAILLWRYGVRNDIVAEYAHHAFGDALARVVCATDADLYIGHCLAALPAVVKAARRNSALAGFDAEDYHSAELFDEGDGRIHNAIARKIEDRYLPYIDHFTAASPLIAKAYEQRFGRLPATLLNVFPLSDAPSGLFQANEKGSIPTFYWFSQTVGPGRGLEDILHIGKRMQRPLRFDFRGHCSTEYEQLLKQLVIGTQIELRILPPENPDRMVALAAGYTAGLALERTTPLNRDICLSNKAFTYLLAGIPIVLSPTSAQSELARALGKAAFLLDSSGEMSTAEKLSQWINDLDRSGASQAAWRLGQRRFNWDLESKTFVSTINRLFHPQADQ
jgi:hypothetical protein